MLYFESDYTEGAHERVLEALVRTNRESLSGYGADRYTESAKQKIREACGAPEAEIFFLAGGTQTNAVVTGTMLRDYEGVVCADTGHIAVHEAGAVEYGGHKVMALSADGGKLPAKPLGKFLAEFYADENREHMVYPGMVYISYPTEYGTVYTRDELKELHEICGEYSIPLYIDGARLGYGLAAKGNYVTVEDIAQFSDVFYIGGTKVGALCGEAVVFPKGNPPRGMTTMIKQRGALLAKGRLLGVQFDALFTDGLYMEISRHAVDMAQRLRAVFQRAGIRFYLNSPTNQQFVVLENSMLERLSERVRFSFWQREDSSHTVVRFCTSWATEESSIEELERILSEVQS